MRARVQKRKEKRYFFLIAGLYLFMSCFTILYFFIFTDSYTDDIRPFSNLVRLEPGEKPVLSGSLTSEKSVFGSDNPVLSVSGKSNTGIVQSEKLLPCGIPVGIYLETKGLLIAEIAELHTAEGMVSSPCQEILHSGDYILEADGSRMESKEQFQKLIEKSSGKEIQLTIEHQGEKRVVAIRPVLTENGEYKAGIWIRDNMHGIGTLTWLDQDGNFAALGHCISDIDTGERMEIDNGKLYKAEIYSLVQSKAEEPGSLAGTIDYRLNSCIGTVTDNTEQGIFGNSNQEARRMIINELRSCFQSDTFEELWEKASVKTAVSDEIKNGKAQMLNCFNGQYQLFDIEIKKIPSSHTEMEGMNLEIQIIDKKLLNQTGGILQGMSGSPIIQDGKLVGAVTHVLVNDPTRGYGIFIENMLDAAE